MSNEPTSNDPNPEQRPSDPAVRYLEPPITLRDAVLVVAARSAGAHTPGAAMELFDQHTPRAIASIDPDEFYDFTAARPLAHTVDGQRQIEWPRLEFFHLALPQRDLVLLSVVEPGLRWQRFGRAIAEVCQAFGVSEAVVLSSFAGGTPHTRPIPLRWVSGSPDTPVRFGATPQTPRYHGPATFPMALGSMLRDHGMTVGTLSVIAPFYLGIDPSPHAVRALLGALAREFDLRFDLSAVEQQIVEVERQAVQQMEDSEQLRVFLADLEEQYDGAHRRIGPGASAAGNATDEENGSAGGASDGPADLPPTDDLLADIEAMLRSSGRSGTGDAGGPGPDPDDGEPGGSRTP